MYAGGRLLAPLLALALVAVLGRERWRWVVTAWAGFAVTQVPLLLYARVHPGVAQHAASHGVIHRLRQTTWLPPAREIEHRAGGRGDRDAPAHGTIGRHEQGAPMGADAIELMLVAERGEDLNVLVTSTLKVP